ncbi:hypothetical protein Tco_0553776 [Tanacetum coccineum]
MMYRLTKFLCHGLPMNTQLTFNQLQKLVSRLAILGVVTPLEDLNVKFFRSLPSEWDTDVVVWMNQNTSLITMGLDDLYNNFNIVEQKYLKTSTAVLVMPPVYASLSTKPQAKRAESLSENWEGRIIIDGESSTVGVKTHEIGFTGSSSKAVRIEDASEKAMCAIDGAGFDWSDMEEERNSSKHGSYGILRF